MPRESASTSGGFTPAAPLATGEAPLSLLCSSSDEEGRMYPDECRPSSIEERGNQTGATASFRWSLGSRRTNLIGLQQINLMQTNKYFCRGAVDEFGQDTGAGPGHLSEYYTLCRDGWPLILLVVF